ncbi:MAG: DUF4389 domain-containing protein [Dehalococcoidia bacterium]
MAVTMDNPPMPGPSSYPVRLDVQYPEKLNNLLPLVKWLLAIPHFIIVYALLIVVEVITVIAFFAILFTTKYPEGLFKFAVGVLRWQANVSAYLYLLRDEYPPFSMDAGQYPVTLEIDPPDQLNRWLPLVKWLLAIPHFVVLIFLSIAVYLTTVIAFFSILFTGKYPEGLFKFAVGVSRYGQRVNCYLLLMTDAYPPFSLD